MGEPKESNLSPEDRVKEIHSIVLAEIFTKTGSFDVWRYFEELNELKKRPLSVTWLETYVMIGCVGQIRPAKVVGNLKRLRNKISPEAFGIFESRMRDYLYPIVLTNHGYREGTFESVNQEEIWSHVKDLMDRLENAGYQVFLNSGTLLGVIRDQSLIAHDDDIDLAVVLDATSQSEAASEWRRLSQFLRDEGLWDEDSQGAPEIHKLNSVGVFDVDLFPAWEQDGHFYVYPHTFGELETSDVLPLKTCIVTGRNIPRDPEEMLALNYGEGWRKPDRFFKFPWAEANENFAEFLQEVQS